MPGRKPLVQAAVQVLQGFLDGLGQFGAGGQQRRQRGRQGVAGAGEAGLDALERLAEQHGCGEASTLSMLVAAGGMPVTST
jgi:hypothetical protein